MLRALASRAPYFHNGSAATLEDVVDFYDTRFSIGLTTRGESGSGRVPARALTSRPYLSSIGRRTASSSSCCLREACSPDGPTTFKKAP